MIKLKQFKKWLSTTNYAEKTKDAYYQAMTIYAKYFNNVDIVSMKAYKAIQIEMCKPQTVNLRIRALNCYNEAMGTSNYHIPFIKVQRRTYLDDVISMADYRHLWKSLAKDGLEDWSMLIRFMGATGARISEVLHFKTEHVLIGHIDIYTKGGKTRRIYIPKRLKEDAKEWIKGKQGLLFTWTPGVIRNRLADFAEMYSIDRRVMHPHSFRHLYGKSFISKYQDIALLADLMGHDSIETTRIYLMRTSAEQATIVDKVVTW